MNAHWVTPGHLALDEHVEEVVVGLGVVGVGHQVAEHRLVAVVVEPEAGEAPPRRRRRRVL